MINWPNAIRSFALVAIFGAIFTAALTFSYVRANLDAQREQAWEELLWTSSQLEIEYLRFARTLALMTAEDPSVDNREVVKRFDILWSRVILFQAPRVQRRLKTYPLSLKPVEQLFVTMTEAETRVTGLMPGQSAEAAEILNLFEIHQVPLHSLNREVMNSEQKREADIWDELLINSTLLTWLSLGTAVLSVALLWFFAAESRRYRRIAAENRGLFDKAEAASKGKSQFLTMMSHELRTPMNGILGTIALAKSQGGTKQQMDLLHHATASGARMNELLGDILDFSALENGEVEIVPAPFTLNALQQHLAQSLDSMSQAGGPTFSVRMESDGSKLVMGDLKRLRQALVHLTAYLADTAAPSAIGVVLNLKDGQLLGDIVLHSDIPARESNSNLSLGEKRLDEHSFSSDSLSPAIARSLVSAMGGEIEREVGNTTVRSSGDQVDRRTIVRVSVPLPSANLVETRVGLEVRTATLAALIKGVLRDHHLRFLESDAKDTAQVMIIEAGREDDAYTVQAIRLRHPDVICLALGEPLDETLFDAVFSLPLDPPNIRNSKFFKIPENS